MVLFSTETFHHFCYVVFGIFFCTECIELFYWRLALSLKQKPERDEVQRFFLQKACKWAKELLPQRIFSLKLSVFFHHFPSTINHFRIIQKDYIGEDGIDDKIQVIAFQFMSLHYVIIVFKELRLRIYSENYFFPSFQIFFLKNNKAHFGKYKNVFKNYLRLKTPVLIGIQRLTDIYAFL